MISLLLELLHKRGKKKTSAAEYTIYKLDLFWYSMFYIHSISELKSNFLGAKVCLSERNRARLKHHEFVLYVQLHTLSTVFVYSKIYCPKITHTYSSSQPFFSESTGFVTLKQRHWFIFLSVLQENIINSGAYVELCSFYCLGKAGEMKVVESKIFS